jgi:tetratricopeptide (TPR) repeat protein
MSKVNVDARKRYLDVIQQYKKSIEEIQDRENLILQVIEKDSTGTEFKRLRLAEENLNILSYYVLMNELSVSLLGVKNEGFLNEARKIAYKAIIYFEQVVTNAIDLAWSEMEDKMAALSSFDYVQRWRLVVKTGFAIQSVMDGYGENTKWKWAFVELEARFATVVKNLLNWKTLFQDSDLNAEGYEVKRNHLNLALKLLEQSATRYRERYELSTLRSDDFKLAIRYLGALRQVHLALNHQAEVESIKKKIEIWEQKLESDQRRRSET